MMSRLVLVLLLIGRESGVRFFTRSESEVKQNQLKQMQIALVAQLKAALFIIKRKSKIQHQLHYIEHPLTQTFFRFARGVRVSPDVSNRYKSISVNRSINR